MSARSVPLSGIRFASQEYLFPLECGLLAGPLLFHNALIVMDTSLISTEGFSETARATESEDNMANASLSFPDFTNTAKVVVPISCRSNETRRVTYPQPADQEPLAGIVGNSRAIQKVLEKAAIVAPTDATVLLLGETGTGKELVARAIHKLSSRCNRAFVPFNCAAIPSGLVESEMFGHERGAFTGALIQKRGRFEVADGGTLFLDEIGDISLDLQPKLLRALQEHEFERLGSIRTIQVDVRIIAATHRDLSDMIRDRQFREDLFYRLNVFPIEVPPLRERREDIPMLVNFFVQRLSSRMRKNVLSVSSDAMDALYNAPWPGNIRELENFIERCVILSEGEDLKVPHDDLKLKCRHVVGPASTLRDAERNVIVEALKSSFGRIAGKNGAAERLGLKRTTLQNKMNRLGIQRSEFAQ